MYVVMICKGSTTTFCPHLCCNILLYFDQGLVSAPVKNLILNSTVNLSKSNHPEKNRFHFHLY